MFVPEKVSVTLVMLSEPTKPETEKLADGADEPYGCDAGDTVAVTVIDFAATPKLIEALEPS